MVPSARFVKNDGMDERQAERARLLIVAGFIVNVLAALIDLANVFGSGTYRFLAFSGRFEVVLAALIAFSATAAWWFLTKLNLERPEQRGLLARASSWFAVQALLGVAAGLNVAWHLDVASWSGSVIWLQAVGEALEAVGFFLWARTVGRTAWADAGEGS